MRVANKKYTDECHACYDILMNKELYQELKKELQGYRGELIASRISVAKGVGQRNF